MQFRSQRFFSTLASALFLAVSSPALLLLVHGQSQYSNEYMTCLVNQARASAGLDPVGMDDALVSAAQAHSDDMARMNNMDHTGSDGSSVGQRCERAGFNWSQVAENIAYGQQSMDDVMRVWMESPGHAQNILNPEYKMMGSAVANSGSTPYYTQVFACDDQPARNIPKCDGNYPDMAAGRSVSPSSKQGGAYGGDDNNGGGNYQPMKSYGGGERGRGGKRRPRSGRHGGHGGDMNNAYGDFGGSPRGGSFGGNDNDWFGEQGFGQRPGGRRPGPSFGGRSGGYGDGGFGGDMFGGDMFGGRGGDGMFGGGRGGFGGGFGGGGFGGFRGGFF